MCGIAGILRLDSAAGHALGGEATAARSLTLDRMGDSLRHRGPDDEGVYVSPDGTMQFIHRRLSVIDLNCGHQPLGNEDGSVWTIFNGEIYNFAELRTELESKGHVFKTHTDTEVLVHLWEEHGPEMVARLSGMFAFAIWDERKRTFFAARDRLGKKPFYYSTDGLHLRFGSELKALMADPALPREIDAEAVQIYLTFGYIPDPWSILRGVKKLPPGHKLLIIGGVVTVERYWQIPRRPTYRGTFDDAKRELREKLTSAVRRRLIADVPLGAFLSGGIDSTVIVGLMSGLLDRPVKTFTIGFDEGRYDESPFAQIAAERFKTEHHQQIVRPDALAILPTLVHHFDEPFGDSSAIPTYYVSKFAREHVTVALTGDGGDEAFGGYRRYRAGKVAGWLNRVRGAAQLVGVVRLLIPASVDRTTNLGRTRRVLENLGRPAAAAYLAQMTQFGNETMAGLLDPSFAAKIDPDLPAHWFGKLYEGIDLADPAAANMSADFSSYLPGDILTKVDRASMAVSLECRSPLLDQEVVEFACSLPTSWRLRGFAGHKYILKEAFADLLPPRIAGRGKSGFAVPLADWFRGPLKALLHDTLLDGTARGRGYVSAAATQGLIDEHLGGKNHASALWTLLMLEMWQRHWLR